MLAGEYLICQLKKYMLKKYMKKYMCGQKDVCADQNSSPRHPPALPGFPQVAATSSLPLGITDEIKGFGMLRFRKIRNENV